MEIKIHNMVLRRFILILLFLSVIFIAASISYAADNNTTNTTNETLVNNTIHNITKNNTLPDPTNTRTGKHYTSIQTAINEAASGDTITLEAGTYYENLVIYKNINLIGAGKDITFINGQQKVSVMYIFPYKTVNISGVTITNGLTSNGGGIYNNNGTVILKNSAICENYASKGAGIFNYQGTVTLQDSTITDNISPLGYGGIFNQGSVYGYGANRNYVYDNEYYDYYGSPIIWLACTNLRTGTDYTSIQAGINEAQEGDTISIYSGTNHENLDIKKNINIVGAGKDSTVIDGGNLNTVIYVESGATVTISGLTIRNRMTQYLQYGGGIYNSGDLTLKDSAVTGIIISGDGGGIYNSYYAVLTLINSQVTGNIVTGNYGSGGGGIFNNHGTITLRDSIISENIAHGTELGGYGGGIYNLYGTVTLYNSKITGNTATGNYFSTRDGNYGGGIYNYGGSSVYADGLSYILYNSPNDIWGGDIIPIPSLGGGLPPATSTNNSNSKTNVSAASTINSKTIGMQETGLPLAGLVLAIFMVLGGLGSKRK